MKLIKAMLQKKRTPSETGFEYPDGWDVTEINVLAYEETGKQGDVEEYCVGIIHDDAYAQALIDGSEGAVIAISEEEANRLGAECKPQRLMVSDIRLGEILAAMDKPKEERTQEELDMLNPDNEADGINKTPKFDVRNWYPG